ncbi:MAG: hypothetical protein ISS15_14815 [Alphaproteobacteria bacterium]|nr:hypothetical protein [Alphaproteobacteria bacterium]MBL6937589.1 hypothetical protein [Alphaproteobacteria bacterium]MBL7098927.1 hypothetical protein [Alphaproteobacteria bacterium]
MTETPDGFSPLKRARTPVAAQARAVAARDRNVVRLWTACPQPPKVSPYDMQHLYVFNWLLDAQHEGVPEAEMARVIFHIDPAREPARAQLVVRTHLYRAHWLMNGDFPFLNW